MQASGLSHAGGVDGTWGSILDGLAGCVAGVALTRTHVGGGTESARRSLANAPASPPAAAAGGGAARAARCAPYLVHWAGLSLFALIVSNVQVATRLMAAACPPFYWHMASLLAEPRSPRVPWLICAYALGYAVCGTALHANFFPWT